MRRLSHWLFVEAIVIMIVIMIMGGFPFARIVHFFFMAAIVAFMVVHVTLVVLVPKTFVAMTLGRATARPHRHAAGTAPGE